MKEKLTNLETLGIAIRSEKVAGQFYRLLAAKIQNYAVKNRIEAIARDEDQHDRVLSELYVRLSGESKAVAAPPNDFHKKQLEYAEKLGDLDFAAALKIAIEAESEAEKLYTDMAAGAGGSDAVRILTYLAEMEAGHRRVLEQELAMLGEDKNWFDKDLGTDIQLVGP